MHIKVKKHFFRLLHCLQLGLSHYQQTAIYVFYARKQLLLLARFSHRNSVCLSLCLSVRPSVRQSHGWISQKRC